MELAIPVFSPEALDSYDLNFVISQLLAESPEAPDGLQAFVPVGGGPVVVLAVNEPIQTSELSIQSSSPVLSVGSDASPFELITTGANQINSLSVTLGSPGITETITSQAITLNVFAESHEGVILSLGDFGEPIEAQALQLRGRPLPEPSGDAMMLAVIAGLSFVRRSRRRLP